MFKAVMKKKSRKGKKRNVSRLQREREMSKQIKGAQNSNFINRASEDRGRGQIYSLGTRRRILAALGISPDEYARKKNS